MTGMIDQVGIERLIEIGQRLRFDALRCIHDQHRAFTGLERAADLIAEVHMPGRIDQVDLILVAVAGLCNTCAPRRP